MQKLPHDYWLKYLIGYVGHSFSDVSDLCGIYNLQPPSKDQFDDISSRVLNTRPKPFRKDSRNVRSWCRGQRISSLVSDSKHANQAREALTDDKVSHALKALILADTDRDEIPDYVADITGRRMTAKAVKLFEHYFWNRDHLSLKEWCDYLEDSFAGKFYVSCRMKHPEWALWKLGYNVSIDSEMALEVIIHESFQRFVETTSMKNDRHTALTAKLWSEQFFSALQEKNKSGDAISQVIDQLRDVSIRLEATEVKDIESLSNGLHSLTEELSHEER